MGLSAKHVNSDEGLDWGKTILESGPKLPLARRQPSQQPPEPVACPRCGSTNTKFCYYNNYNKSQPRHFCRACKRHWTKGGTLRNVPVGGGRKNKRRKTAVATTTAATAATAATIASQQQISQSLVGDQKDTSGILFHDFINNSCNFSVKGLSGNNGNFVGSTLPPFTFSSLGTFERYPSSISTSFGSLDDFNFIGGLASNNIASQPLCQVPTTSGVMDLPQYWNWEEMESLVSSHDLNLPWDDCEIKP